MSVDSTIAVDGDVIYGVSIDELYSFHICAQRLVAGLDAAIVFEVGATIEGGTEFEMQVDIAAQNERACLVRACWDDDATAAVGRTAVDALL